MMHGTTEQIGCIESVHGSFVSRAIMGGQRLGTAIVLLSFLSWHPCCVLSRHLLLICKIIAAASEVMHIASPILQSQARQEHIVSSGFMEVACCTSVHAADNRPQHEDVPGLHMLLHLCTFAAVIRNGM